MFTNSKKYLPVVALISIAPLALAADWQPISGNNSDPLIYMDMASFKPGSGEVWLLLNYKEPYGPNVRSGKMLVRFDCKNRTLQVPINIRYDAPMGKGNVVDYQEVLGHMPVVPGSNLEAMYEMACLGASV